MNILTLGGGQMGSEAARDLYKKGYGVTVVDKEKIVLPDIETIQADLSDPKQIDRLISDYDLIACALPAKLGYSAVERIVRAGKPGVDLSYCTENLLDLDDEAKKNGSLIIIDGGIDPGITNFIAGRALYKGRNNIKFCLGGFSRDENAPLGYAPSWSVEDLLEEYQRPARIIVDGEIKVVKALSGVERIYFPGAGILEAFYTDNLRSLLRYRPEEIKARKATVIGKTMRRSGHMDEMIELINSGKYIDFIEKNCIGLKDMLAMRVLADGESVDLLVDSDEEMSAMARSTALSFSAFIQLVADGTITGSGIVPPEVLAENDDVYVALLDKLADNGLRFTTRYPFL